MALTVGTDTYATLVEALAYTQARPALTTGWAAIATDDLREAYMREAAIYLDQSYSWKGVLADFSQSMAWPRYGVVDREKRELAATVPQVVKDAQCELAALAASNPLVNNYDTGDIESIKAGEVSIKFLKGQRASEGERFAWIDRLLNGLYTGRTGSGTANVGLVRV
jgi:hypothetical protein